MTDDIVGRNSHVFNGGTCVYCHADDHDIDLPDECPVTEGRKEVWTFEEGRNDMTRFEAEAHEAELDNWDFIEQGRQG